MTQESIKAMQKQAIEQYEDACKMAFKSARRGAVELKAAINSPDEFDRAARTLKEAAKLTEIALEKHEAVCALSMFGVGSG